KPSALWLEKDWNKFDIATITQEEVDALEAPLEAFFKGITCQEFFEGVVERDMLGYPVATPRENLNDPQLRARDYWAQVEHPELGATLTYPGAFARFSETTCGIRRRAPGIGEHNEEVYRELGLSRAELAALKGANVI
ncbi:MAG: CoA transferase, partial [Chloroflexi bacterium]|nr:CoA transferase [Chloroflexota bacterium]